MTFGASGGATNIQVRSTVQIGAGSGTNVAIYTCPANTVTILSFLGIHHESNANITSLNIRLQDPATGGNIFSASLGAESALFTGYAFPDAWTTPLNVNASGVRAATDLANSIQLYPGDALCWTFSSLGNTVAIHYAIQEFTTA